MASTKILSISPIDALEYVERLSTIADRHGMTLQEAGEFVAKIAESERGETLPGNLTDEQTRICDFENRFFDMGSEAMLCAIEKAGGSFEPKAIALFSISLRRSIGVPLFDGATLSRIGSASGCHFDIPKDYFRPTSLTLTGINISPKSLRWPETMVLVTPFTLVGEEDESFWAFLIHRIGDGRYEIDRMAELMPSSKPQAASHFTYGRSIAVPLLRVFGRYRMAELKPNGRFCVADLNIPPPSGEIPPVPISGHASFGCVSAPFFANDRQAEAAQIARGLDRSLQAIHALTAMCRQWLTKPETPRLLDHSFISACEFAIDVLMDLGICAEGDKGFYLVDPPPTDQEIIDRLTAP